MAYPQARATWQNRSTNSYMSSEHVACSVLLSESVDEQIPLSDVTWDASEDGQGESPTYCTGTFAFYSAQHPDITPFRVMQTSSVHQFPRPTLLFSTTIPISFGNYPTATVYFRATSRTFPQPVTDARNVPGAVRKMVTRLIKRQACVIHVKSFNVRV